MPLLTFDNREIKTQLPFSHDYRTDTGNNSTTKHHYYTIQGDGYVVVTISVECTGSTSDYGSTLCYVYLNNSLKSFGYNRVTTANTENQGGITSVGLEVKSGDVIHVQIDQTKNGAKTFRYYCFCVIVQ